MIYTFGCSFTKWFWPTWADWLKKYSNDKVVNLGWPGLSNQTMYYELLNRMNKIKKKDHVYVMFTGSNRISQWFDPQFILRNQAKNFFPRSDGKLECSDSPWIGMYRNFNTHSTSYTHQVITTFNTIFQMQNILDKIGCGYTFMFWLNPWADTRPRVEPEFTTTWQNTRKIKSNNLRNARQVMNLPVVQKILQEIKWKKFVGLEDLDINDVNTYTGLWEFNLKNIKQNISVVHDSDLHPDTYTQYQFYSQYISRKTNAKQNATAYALAEKLKKCSVKYDYSFLIPDNYENQIYKEDI